MEYPVLFTGNAEAPDINLSSIISGKKLSGNMINSFSISEASHTPDADFLPKTASMLNNIKQIYQNSAIQFFYEATVNSLSHWLNCITPWYRNIAHPGNLNGGFYGE